MRVIVFFDLPTTTPADKKQYLNFRKFLITEGFIMMQESVYCKIVLNSSNSQLLRNKLDKHKPSSGLVQVLIITEKQYAGIEYLCGKAQETIIDTDRRLIII